MSMDHIEAQLRKKMSPHESWRARAKQLHDKTNIEIQSCSGSHTVLKLPSLERDSWLQPHVQKWSEELWVRSPPLVTPALAPGLHCLHNSLSGIQSCSVTTQSLKRSSDRNDKVKCEQDESKGLINLHPFTNGRLFAPCWECSSHLTVHVEYF